MKEIQTPMSWRDAIVVSLVLMLAQIFIAFFALYNFQRIMEDWRTFLFELFKFAGATFFANLLSLMGLSIAAKNNKK